MAVLEATAAPPPDDPLSGDGSDRHARLGAIMLDLVSDWGSWVAHRVDKFHLVGDDERVLQRHQSMDFLLPPHLASCPAKLTDELGGFPVPIAFMHKWQLPELSLRDAANHSVPLLQREQSIPIAAGMLIALGTFVRSDGAALVPSPVDDWRMPYELRDDLFAIVASEPGEALRRCADLAKGGDDDAVRQWRATLAQSDLFMSLAYELAVGFLVMGLTRRPAERNRFELAHTSYIVPTHRDRLTVRLSHLRRWARLQRRDAIDPISWQQTSSRTLAMPAPERATGELVISTLCERGAPEGISQGPLALACALAELDGQPGRRAIRLRPTGVVAMKAMPAGRYKLRMAAQSGFSVTPDHVEVVVEAGRTTRIHLRAQETQVPPRGMLAPSRLAARASLLKLFQRGCGWSSRPLAIRVRLGSAASYDCEFEAPSGMHVTRSRLVGDYESGATDAAVGAEPSPERDIHVVLKSTHLAHLYAPAHRSQPATGYAILNLRPRVETIVRPALVTAVAAMLVLAVIAMLASDDLFANQAKAPWTVLGLLLGAPSALSAYFAQAVPSRVTNAMLYGLRIIALLPAVLSIAAAAAILLTDGSELAVLPSLIASLLVLLALTVTYRYAEHPPEQKPPDPATASGT